MTEPYYDPLGRYIIPGEGGYWARDPYGGGAYWVEGQLPEGQPSEPAPVTVGPGPYYDALGRYIIPAEGGYWVRDFDNVFWVAGELPPSGEVFTPEIVEGPGEFVDGVWVPAPPKEDPAALSRLLGDYVPWIVKGCIGFLLIGILKYGTELR